MIPSIRRALLDRALAGCDVHDLVHPLVAQLARVPDLPQRPAGSVQLPDCVLVGDLGQFCFVLQADQAIPVLFGLT